MKTCTKCGIAKESQDFVKDPQKKDGLYSSCKKCNRDYNRDRAKKAVYDKEHRKLYVLRKKALQFGVTEDYLLFLRDKQNNRCAICEELETALDMNGNTKALAVDHDWDTNKVRGLLCQRCNTAIGLLRDSPKLLRNGIQYLLDAAS